ncbi:hypothetical protein ACFONN_13590 [Dyella humi]|uniref:Uncharacterized protein n=1 Tax=Dyella humi TaxID=1770547 RepID=A0ABW8ILE4_9GAMM
MKLSARSAALYSVTFAGLLALSACGKNEQQPANQPAASSTAPAPASTAQPAPSATAAVPAHASTAPAPAPASTAAAAPAAPAAAESLQVSTITLGDVVSNDHKVKKEVTTFSPSQKTIYVSVDTTGSTPGATINAKWSYLEGNGQVVTSTSQSIIADGPATTTFRVQNPNQWPEGKYKVDISLDGKQVASKNFEVKKS